MISVFLNRVSGNLCGLAARWLIYPIAERREKRVITPKLRILRAEAALPFTGRRAAALNRLADVLEHAGRTVPYYRDLFTSRQFDPAKVRLDARYLESLPYLTKDILREQGKRLLSEPHVNRIVHEQKTGSSTGPAATVYYDREATDWTAAQNILMMAWAGKRRYNRETHLSTRFEYRGSPHDQRREAAKCLALNRVNIYTDGFGEAAQERLLADLKRAGVRSVQGHSSSLFALARWLKKQDRSGAGLFDFFVSTGEMMTPLQRDLIEDVFQARVSDRYGACEFGVMAQELAEGPRGEMLVSDSLVWPEVFEADEGGTGELVFTNLRNLAMPLIRYRMGDLGRLEERENGWWIQEITGRTHDSVEIEGEIYPTHYIQDIFDRCGPVSDFQIRVREGQAVEFRLVAEEAAWEGLSAAVRSNFPSVPLKRISPEELVFVGVRGKFSYILREESTAFGNR